MKALTAASVAILIASTVLAAAPATDQYIVSTGRLQGQCPNGVCALFRTDAWIFNPSTTASASVTITFLPRQPNPSPANTATVTVGPNNTLELTDIYQNPLAFNLDGVGGALRFVSTIPVIVSARVYDANTQTGSGTATVGQYNAGMSAQDAIGLNQSADVIALAEQTNVWRSNLDLVETTGNSASFKIERIDPSGNVVGTAITDTIGVREARHYNDILAANGWPSPASNGRVRVTVTAGSGRLLVIASRLDSRSGDPFTVEMTTAAVSSHSAGIFEGVILDPSGAYLNGGARFTLGASGLNEAAGITGIPCGTNLSFTVDYDYAPTTPVQIGSDGTFTATIAGSDGTGVVYTDGTNTVFKIIWTINGQLSSAGVITGVVTSQTSGGSGEWAPCNGTATAGFRAGWASDS